MVRKIKPQRAQRITESCYFYLSPLCHYRSSVVFRNLISKISKSLRVFGHRNARYQRPVIISARRGIIGTCSISCGVLKNVCRYKNRKSVFIRVNLWLKVLFATD